MSDNNISQWTHISQKVSEMCVSNTNDDSTA